jgi:hypothetical protein
MCGTPTIYGHDSGCGRPVITAPTTASESRAVGFRTVAATTSTVYWSLEIIVVVLLVGFAIVAGPLRSMRSRVIVALVWLGGALAYFALATIFFD